MKRLLRSLMFWRRSKPSRTPREDGNINRTVELVRNRTHPELPKSMALGPIKRIPAEGRIHGMWCIRSPWHNGAWIGGYYNPSNNTAVTVANPNDMNDYDDRVEQHEIAHRLELVLRMPRRWHDLAWRQDFMNWWEVPAVGVAGGEIERCDKTHKLPYCEEGDIVEVDLVG